jgi:hypothetical protein
MRASAEILREVDRLVCAWCDRRKLSALRRILQGWPLNAGLTDDWGALLDALEKVRGFATSELTEDERVRIDSLISDVGEVLGRR